MELNEVSLKVTMKVSDDSFLGSSCQFSTLFLCKFFALSGFDLSGVGTLQQA